MVNGVLPDSWEWTTVGECSTVITGRTPSKKDDSNYGNFMPFVKPPELLNGSIFTAEDNISEKGTKDARVLPINSVLVSCIGNLGKTGINRVPVAFNQQINAVIFPEYIIPEFGFYYFQSSEFKRKLEGISSATTVAIVNKSKFESLPFPIAPLPEQERIVAKIEELFTQLDVGTSALERVQAGLRRYQASVLKTACEGKLVVQDANEGTADNLLEKFKLNGNVKQRIKRKFQVQSSEVVEPIELPQNWQWVVLGELGLDISDGNYAGLYPKANEFLVSGVPFIRATNIRDDFTIDPNEMRYISEKLHDRLQRGHLLLNDILVVTRGAGTGDVALVTKEFVDFNINAQLVRINVGNLFIPKYFLYALASDNQKKQFNLLKTGSATPQLPIGQLMQLRIPLPPLEEQRRIVAEVERRLSVAREVESNVEAALVRAARLRQAVLKSAFEGRLV